MAQSRLPADEFVLGIMARQNIPGLPLSVITDGHIAVKSYGERRAASGLFVNNETIFEAASLSKPVFALLVLQLEQEKLIDLDLPLHQYIPDSNAYGPDFFESSEYLGITARMVLTHTSGLPNGTPTPGAIHFLPGSRFAYSGTGFRFLHAAITEITAQSLTQLLDTYIFDPLDMNNSSFLWRDEFEQNSTWGHDSDGEIGREILHLDSEFPEGGFVTNISDYSIFVRFLLNEYEAANPVIRRMLEPAVEARDYSTQGSMSWGLGWGIEEAELGNRFWHTGSNGVFKTFALGDPANKSALIFFANAENGLEIVPELLEQTIGATELSDDYQRTISESRVFRPVIDN
ncbi:MAG: serine hydrolase [Pseudomonadales bacterium]|nr:serine hydrolase [Pseudomonadales bacterium]